MSLIMIIMNNLPSKQKSRRASQHKRPPSPLNAALKGLITSQPRPLISALISAPRRHLLPSLKSPPTQRDNYTVIMLKMQHLANGARRYG